MKSQSSEWLGQKSPEAQLLFFSCRTRNRLEKKEQIGELVQQVTNWNSLLGAAACHKLESLLYWCLAPHEDKIPPEQFRILRAKASGCTARSAELLQEICTLSKVLADQSIPVLHLKGPTLGLLAYEDYALRHAGDIDVLLRQEDIHKCLDVMEAHGYAPTLIESAKPATLAVLKNEAILKHGCELTLSKSGSNIALDIHWLLMKKPYFDVPTTLLWETSRRIVYRKQELVTLSRALNFLYVARHAAKHGWTNLRWIADLVAIMENDFDFSEAMAIAYQLKYRKFTLFAMCLAAHCPGVSIPDEVVESIEKYKVTESVQWLLNVLFPDAKLRQWVRMSEIRTVLFMSSLEDSRSSSMKMLGENIFRPTLRDWEYMQAPSILLPLVRYYRLMTMYLLRK